MTSYNPKIRRAVKEYTTRATVMESKPKSNCKEQVNTTHPRTKQYSTLLNSKTQVTTPVQSSRHPRFKLQLPTSHQGSLRPLPTRTTTSNNSNNRRRHLMPRRMPQVASHLPSLRQLLPRKTKIGSSRTSIRPSTLGTIPWPCRTVHLPSATVLVWSSSTSQAPEPSQK